MGKQVSHRLERTSLGSQLIFSPEVTSTALSNNAMKPRRLKQLKRKGDRLLVQPMPQLLMNGIRKRKEGKK